MGFFACWFLTFSACLLQAFKLSSMPIRAQNLLLKMKWKLRCWCDLLPYSKGNRSVSTASPARLGNVAMKTDLVPPLLLCACQSKAMSLPCEQRWAHFKQQYFCSLFGAWKAGASGWGVFSQWCYLAWSRASMDIPLILQGLVIQSLELAILPPINQNTAHGGIYSLNEKYHFILRYKSCLHVTCWDF